MKNLILFCILSVNVFAMSAPATCSQQTFDYRQTGYKYLLPLSSLSIFTATALTAKDMKENQTGEDFTDELSRYFVMVAGSVVGIVSWLDASSYCRVTEKKTNWKKLPEMTKKQGLEYRENQRRIIRKNLLINTSMIGLFSVLSKNDSTKNSLYLAAGIPLVVAGVQSYFLNDDDLKSTSMTFFESKGSFVPGIAFSARF